MRHLDCGAAIDQAFASMRRQRAAALIVLPNPFFMQRRSGIARLAAQHRIPVSAPYRIFAKTGFLFANPAINDFKAEVLKSDQGNDELRLSIEVRRGSEGEAVAALLAISVKQKYELTPEVLLLPSGTLAREFESAIKAPRFVDRRS